MKNTIKTFKPFNFKPKPFLKINEQINLLATRGLNIVNRNRLIKYIKNYNYQNFVNGYNDLLFINEDRKFNKYKNDVNSNDLIEIFNFDRWIGFMILSNILNIERMISSYITTVICEYMSKYDEYSFILNWDLDTYKYIFKEYFDDNSNNTKSETKKFDDIKKIIKGEFIKKKSYSLLVNKYKNCENDIPLWTLSIYWTFGAINKLFKYLNQELSNKVLENISFNISKKELFIILESFRLLRNDYCHNCVIYNFSYQIYDKIDSPILISGSNRIWIYEIICILDKLNKREHKDNSLKNLIEGKIKEVS